MTGERARSEAGFSLIEVLVAVVLIAIVMAGLFPVTFKVALQSRQANVTAQRTSKLAAEVEYTTAAGFTSLTAGSTCTTFSSADFPHTKCVTIVDVNANRKRVTIVITPTNGSGIGAATTVVERSRGANRNPLNMP